jgi:hypothetical protein
VFAHVAAAEPGVKIVFAADADADQQIDLLALVEVGDGLGSGWGGTDRTGGEFGA